MESKADVVTGILKRMYVELTSQSKVFMSDDEYDSLDGDEDRLYDLPTVQSTDKNAHYLLTYAVLAIDNGEVLCVGLGETEGNEVFDLESLGYNEMINIYRNVFE